MPVGADELYCNLNKLLGDICKFLQDETNYEKLSPAARKQADELIGRSKRQLLEITKIVKENNEYDGDGAYVDMEKKPAENSEDDDDSENFYTPVDESIPPKPTVITNLQTENPYSNLPAKELSQKIKYGPLSWRCRFIFKIEKMRRIYAGIHDNWLLIYSSERDCKPLQTLNLKYHTAQNALSKQGKQLEQDFEMVCTYGEKKTYYFTAMTHKDMLQWISHINRCHKSMNEVKNPNPLLHTGDDDDSLAEYDIIDEPKFKPNEENKGVEKEEGIYDQIAPVPASQNRVIQNINKPPDLPARRILKPKPPVPQIPPRKEEEELSESSTYDPVDNSNASLNNNDNNSLASDNSSFSSESESEPIYDTYVNRN